MIRVEIKPGVILGEINDYLIAVCTVMDDVLASRGATPTISSGIEGQHMLVSLHYQHKAWDFRSWGFLDPQAVFDEVRIKLRALSTCWQVLYGDRYHLNHAHIEYDLKHEGD